VVRQDGLDEEGVGVAHHLEVTPATANKQSSSSSSNTPASTIGPRRKWLQ
jgi:hypothetical protein